MQTATVTDRIVEPEQGHEPAETPLAPEEAPARRKLPRAVLAGGAAVAIALGGIAWITARPSAESTDDAYLAADTTSVAPKVRGLIEAVLVRDNQTVHRGDPLVRIDGEEFDARVAAAEADLADADAGVADARAALVSLGAEQRLASATVAATRTSIRSAEAEAGRAASDQSRYDALVATGAVARRDADIYRTTAIGAVQSAAKARAQLVVAERQAGVTSAQRGTLDAALAKALAQRQRAAAALDLARQDQRHTLIRAPIDGVIGDRQVRVGDYVQPGSRLMSLVPIRQLYVTANFKETQTRDMRVGQPVSIDVDALHGEPLTGRVESFAPGSGSTFALLPFEPGTGNFTKIVQRVPVRIRLDPGQRAAAALRPGLSVTAKVRLSR
ncbi:MAG: HlyD family secretion protein [Candidatus Andeanibacterium colombiense]|uniref:HlyD family secretion protein n=1 Tax=Candidatus Andeanibacterium colombiense TaxID=3121345 RepID=A0AAJ6BPA8_9SPHN|nr:MAG: HlyD family secretion protein [Sphingomonadaceae bacterium]